MSDENTLLFISEADTVALLNWPDVIACLAAAYAAPDEPAAVPPRVVARKGTAWLRVLSALSPSGRHMGVKIIARARKPQSSYLIPLWDQDGAELVCLLDGKHITGMRTAGTTAMAVDRILSQAADPRRRARRRPGSTGARQRDRDRCAPFTALKVYSPTPASRDGFARKFAGQLKVDCRAVDSARAAIEGADLIIAAARSRDETPILQGAWLKPGTMVISIGSTLQEQIEVDPEVIRRADVIVADVPEEVMHETGDMLAAAKAGVSFRRQDGVARGFDAAQTCGRATRRQYRAVQIGRLGIAGHRGGGVVSRKSAQPRARHALAGRTDGQGQEMNRLVRKSPRKFV